MKKLLTLTLAILMALTLVACGGSRSHTNGNNGGSVSDSTSESVSESNSTTYGTIPMPDGFPSNLGDAEFFNPATDDYVLSGRHLIFLVSYDEQGNAVQFVSKSVGTEDRMPFLESTRNAHGTEKGIEVVGNVIYYDWLKIYDEGGYGLTDDAEPVEPLEKWYQRNTQFPTKTGPLWDRGPQSGGVIDLREERFGGYYYSKP